MSLLSKHNANVTVTDLCQIDSSVNTLYGSAGRNDALLQGEFFYLTLADGLSSHGGTVTELETLKNTFELPAGISINLIFQGSFEFVLQGKTYEAQTTTDQHATGLVITMNKPETITRYLRQGQKVSKLNLFAEREWLLKRFSPKIVARLLANHAAVNSWPPDDRVIELAREVITNAQHNSPEASLICEARLLEIFSLYFQQFDPLQTPAVPIRSEGLRGAQLTKTLKKRIDKNIHRNSSLESLADDFGVSISTLQRRFKNAYGVTVIDYIRQQRLEAARSAMIRDGLSIGEAAYLAGYKYPSNFFKAFKKHFQMTPLDMLSKHS